MHFPWQTWSGPLRNLGVQNGLGALASDFTNATSTLNNTNLSFPVQAGHSYKIKGLLKLGNSTAAEGCQFDFGGGSCSATTFFAAITGTAGTMSLSTTASTSLTGALSVGSATDPDYLEVSGYLNVNAAGTLILRFAENSGHVLGTATLHAGSWLELIDISTL